MAEVLEHIHPAFIGAFMVWFLMLYAKMFERSYGDKALWEEIMDRMQYLTGAWK